MVTGYFMFSYFGLGRGVLSVLDLINSLCLAAAICTLII